MNADGSGVTNLTNDAAVEFDPAWSPDGTRIAFASTRHGPSSIWVMRSDGPGAARITVPDTQDVQPAWSPDGRRIAFARLAGGYQIYVMNADGTGVTKLTSHEFGAQEPSWSPYGTHIAYQVAVFQGNGEMDPGPLGEIWVMNPDGIGNVRLTGSLLPSTETSLENPVWSPDGTAILFVAQSYPMYAGLYLVNPDGTNLRLLTVPGFEQMPSWQPTLLPIPWDFGGFDPPIDREPVVNVTKGGRAIPLRFTLGGDKGMDLFLTGYPKFVTEDCEGGETEDVVETTVDAPAGLTYDRGSDRYLYVWKTSSQLAGRCGKLVLGLRDRSRWTASFRFTR
ncbi:MAG TPA: PxKF domain-containing protein [Gemmatimonadales bacterium]|nr:PxKF domain-containing protein [Gemmatimonadales bacterium]